MRMGYMPGLFDGHIDTDSPDSQRDQICVCHTSSRPGKFVSLDVFRRCDEHLLPAPELYKEARNAYLEPGFIVHVLDKCAGSRIHNRVMLLLKKNDISDTWQAASFCYHDAADMGRQYRQVHRLTRSYQSKDPELSSPDTVDIDLLCDQCQLQPGIMINIQENWLMETSGTYYKVGEVPEESFKTVKQEICKLFCQDMGCVDPEGLHAKEGPEISTSPKSPKLAHQTHTKPARKDSVNRGQKGGRSTATLGKFFVK